MEVGRYDLQRTQDGNWLWHGSCPTSDRQHRHLAREMLQHCRKANSTLEQLEPARRPEHIAPIRIKLVAMLDDAHLRRRSACDRRSQIKAIC